MNYFELLEIPPSFYPDMGLLKRQYFTKSREYHPDYFTTASEDEKAKALEMTSKLNQAYKTLNSFQSRMKYILQLEGILTDGEKDELPQEFLFEMMDINERLDELESHNEEDSIQSFKLEIDNLVSDLNAHVKVQLESYPTEKSGLLEIKNFYFKHKYLSRIKARLENL